MHVSIDSLITLQISVCVWRVVRWSSVFIYISTSPWSHMQFTQVWRGSFKHIHLRTDFTILRDILWRVHPKIKIHIFPLTCIAKCPSRDVHLILNIMELDGTWLVSLKAPKINLKDSMATSPSRNHDATTEDNPQTLREGSAPDSVGCKH